MEERLVSIIVPVYNVEMYLDRCLTSILNQSYHNLEIILVDDGSTDQSGMLCDEYQKRDVRIQVIHKRNGGLSDARNVGIQNSLGSYIAFIDSDDYIHKEYVKQMMKKVEVMNCDVVISSYIKMCANGESVNYIVPGGIYDGKQIQKNLYGQKVSPELFDVAWNKLYRKTLFKNVCFPKGKIHEDMFTTYKVLYLCKKICTLSEPLYYYEIRNASISQTKNYAEKTDRVLVEKERMEFYSRNGETEMFLFAQKAYFYQALNYAKDIMVPIEKRAAYIQECNLLYRKMLFNAGYTFLEKMGIVRAVVRSRGILHA